MKISPIDDELTTETLNILGRAPLTRLLEELFPGRTEILFQAITPGVSGSSVLLTYPHKTHMQAPCVVKVGPTKDIRTELDAFTRYVAPYIRNENLPGILASSFSDNIGGIAFQFYAKTTLAARLQQLAESEDTRQLAIVLRRLLNTLAEAWNVSKDLLPRNLFRDDYPLTDLDLTAFEHLCSSIPEPLGVSADDGRLVRHLWARGDTLAGNTHFVSICHGDLHGQNVLLNPEDRFCFIDFTKVNRQHYLRDFITLEGDLLLRLFPTDEVGLQEDTAPMLRLLAAATPPFPTKSGRPKRRTNEPRVLVPALTVLSEIRAQAWKRMENKRSEIPGYEIGLIRRLVRTTTRPENMLTDAQRWVGVHMAIAYCRHLDQTMPGSRPVAPSARTRLPVRSRRRESVNGLDEPQSELAVKVRRSRGREHPSIVLIGGVYLDMILKPIETIALQQEEWSNLSPLKLCLGGSCIQVGRVLKEHFGLESTLYSAMGGLDDPISIEARRLLDREGWIANDVGDHIAGVSTAVSVHLQQGSADFTTIFTHRGALEYLGWPRIFRGLLEVHESGGFVYIAGYFRTSLDFELDEYLRRLGTEQIVVIDHGRLVPEVESPQAVRALKQAFRRGLIDIYICTLSELSSLVNYPTRSDLPPIGERSVNFVRTLVANADLPPVTVIRDDDWPGRSRACLLYSPTNSIELLTARAARVLRRGEVGVDNAFNAGFLHGLASGREDEGLWSALEGATREGIRTWQEVDG